MIKQNAFLITMNPFEWPALLLITSNTDSNMFLWAWGKYYTSKTVLGAYQTLTLKQIP